MLAIAAGKSVPQHQPLDLALYVAGAVNCALDTLAPDSVLASIAQCSTRLAKKNMAAPGTCEAVFLADLADIALLVSDRDRLEVLSCR